MIYDEQNEMFQDMLLSLSVLSRTDSVEQYYRECGIVPDPFFLACYESLHRFFRTNCGILRPFFRNGENGRLVWATLLDAALYGRRLETKQFLYAIQKQPPEEMFFALLRCFDARMFTARKLCKDRQYFQIYIRSLGFSQALISELCALYDCVPMLNMYLTSFLMQYERIWTEEYRKMLVYFADERMRIRRLFDSHDTPLLRLPYSFGIKRCRYFISMFAPYSYYCMSAFAPETLAVGLFFEQGGDLKPMNQLDPFELLLENPEVCTLLYVLLEQTENPMAAAEKTGLGPDRLHFLSGRLVRASYLYRDVFGNLRPNPDRTERICFHRKEHQL